jgi:hypothetical protein
VSDVRRATGAGAASWLAPLAAGCTVAAYAAVLRRYGIFDFPDEGTLLVQAWRVVQGQAPYVDFHTGYGPLYFRLQGLLVAAGGIEAVRWALVVLHGAAAAALFVLTRRLAGAPLAWVAVALQVAFFLPIAPRQGAPFLVPYPAWYAGLAGVALAVLLAASPGLGRAAAAGVLSAAVFAVKPNSGLLLAGGAAAALILAHPHGAGGRALGRLVLAVLALAGMAVVAATGLSTTALVLVPPLVGLVTLSGANDRLTARRLTALGAGFVPVALVCFLPLLLGLGPGRFAREVLLLGAGVAEIYAVDLPASAVLAAAVGLGIFCCARIAAATPSALLIAALLALAVAFASGLGRAAASLSALRLGAEEALLALVPLVVWGSLAMLRRREDAWDPSRAWVPLASVLALQLYPRADLVHLMPLGPLLLPLALRLWRTGARGLGLPSVVLVAVPLALAAGRFAPTATTLAHLARGEAAAVRVAGTSFIIEAAAAEPLRALAAAVDAARLARAGDASTVAFPACGLVPFFAGLVPAGPHDYFFPGRPSRAEVAALASTLAAAPPPLAVTCDAAGSELAVAWNYYPELTGLLAARYRVLLARPPFTVRLRGD